MSLGKPSSISSSQPVDNVYGKSPLSNLSSSSYPRMKNDFFAVSKIETFYGMVESSTDALRIFQLCREGKLGRVRRRLHDHERRQIRSGSIFVFNESESGIKRWTDGRLWSPSRIFGDFLIYRELERKYARRTSIINHMNNKNDIEIPSLQPGAPTLVTSYHLISSSASCPVPNTSRKEAQLENEQKDWITTNSEGFILANASENSQLKLRAEILNTKFKSSFFSSTSPIAISLNTSDDDNGSQTTNKMDFISSSDSYLPLSAESPKQILINDTVNSNTISQNSSPKSLFIIREDGLIKKTLSMTIDGQLHHMVCYYSKLDFMLGRETRNLPFVPHIDTAISATGNSETVDEFIKPNTFPFSFYNQIFPQILPRPVFTNKKEDPVIKRKRRHSSNSIPSEFNPGRKILPSPSFFDGIETRRMAGMRANSCSGYVSNSYPLNYNNIPHVVDGMICINPSFPMQSSNKGSSLLPTGFNDFFGPFPPFQFSSNSLTPSYGQAFLTDPNLANGRIFASPMEIPLKDANISNRYQLTDDHSMNTTLPDFAPVSIKPYDSFDGNITMHHSQYPQNFVNNSHHQILTSFPTTTNYGIINSLPTSSHQHSLSSTFNTDSMCFKTKNPSANPANAFNKTSSSAHNVDMTNSSQSVSDNYFSSENILHAKFHVEDKLMPTCLNEENLNVDFHSDEMLSNIHSGEISNSSFESGGFNSETMLTSAGDILNSNNTILIEPNGHFPSSLL